MTTKSHLSFSSVNFIEIPTLIARVISSVQFISVAQSCPTLCDPMNCSLSVTISQSSLRLTSIKSVMPSRHLILGCPLQPNFGTDNLVMSMCSHLLCCWKRVFAMTSMFSWQTSVSLCPASFCIPRPNVPVTPGIS